MPDPPILRDGKQVRCETWETVVRQTLEANADHYPLPVHRKLCVLSPWEGKPRLSIAPRITSDSSNPYVDAEDIMVHLKTGCANPNRRAEAYAAYRKLIMKPKDDFPISSPSSYCSLKRLRSSKKPGNGCCTRNCHTDYSVGLGGQSIRIL